MKLFTHFIFISWLFFTSQQTIAQKLAAIPYVSGISAPTDLKNCGDDRLFVAERGGRIRVINADGALRATPFLDITSKNLPSLLLRFYMIIPAEKLDNRQSINQTQPLNFLHQKKFILCR